MSTRRTLAVTRKEILHIIRDRGSITMALALPVLLLLMFGMALSLDVDRIRTAVHDADQSPASRELIERFRGSRFFEIQRQVDRQSELGAAIDRDEILIGIAVPRGYGREIESGRTGTVQFLIDGSDSNTASIALGYAESLVRSYSFELRRQGQSRRGGGSSDRALLTAPIDVRSRVWYNPELESKNYVVPGLIAVTLMIISALLTSQTIAREWESGTMEQLLSTPVRPAELVLGKMFAYFAVGVINTTLALAIGIGVFGVPFRGDALFLAAGCCVFLVGASFWGIFVSAVARNQLLAFQMGLLSSFLPSFLLSGFVYAIESMPVFFRVVTNVVPARHFVTILKGVFLKGSGPSMLWQECLFLTLLGAFVFVAATRRLNGRIA